MTGDWRFLLRPKWLLSHLFVGALLAAFLWAGFWQLRRLDDKKEMNAIVEARSQLAPVTISDIHDLAPDDVAFQPVADTGHYVDDELIRVANRSLDGVAGDWIVAHFVTDDGEDVLVNRGFILRDEVAAPPLDPTHLDGWFRTTEVKDGAFGATDTGTGERVPRLDVALLSDRFGINAVSAWVQLEPTKVPIPEVGATEVLPEALDLPPLTNGNHFSYAVQWFVFTVLGGGAYVLVLRKLVRQRSSEIGSDSTD